MPKPFPPDYFVRVKDDETGAEFTQPAHASRDGVTVIDKPAVDANGDPLAAKTNAGLNGESLPANTSTEQFGGSKTGHKADSTEGKPA